MKNIDTYRLFENFSGSEAFNVFLKIIGAFGNVFLKNRSIFDHSDYILFFYTDKISDNTELEYELSLRDSLVKGYKAIMDLKDKKLSFYFGVRDNKLSYGFYSDNKAYKIGEFNVINLKFLPNIECLNNVYFVRNYNLKSLHFLKTIKKDFESFDSGDIDILNDRIIRMVKDRNQLPYDDNQLLRHLDYWVEQQPWRNRMHSYMDQEDDKVKYYLKVK